MAAEKLLRLQIIDLLAEETGILAEVIFDEVLEDIGIADSQLSGYWAGKFIRVLDKKLPHDISDRHLIIRKVGALFIHA